MLSGRDAGLLGLIGALCLGCALTVGWMDAQVMAPGLRGGVPLEDKPCRVRVERRELPERVEVTNPTPLSDELYAALVEACDTYEVPMAVALGIIEVESGFEADAVNPAGCYGLMQLSPRYFPGGLSPAENITVGVGYLREQADRYGDLEAGLTAYRWGYDTGEREYAEAVFEAAEKWRDGQ